MQNSLDHWRNFSSNPFRDFGGLHKSVERMLDDFATHRPQSTGSQSFSPLCEVMEDKSAFYFKIEMPGIPKDQIKIHLEENQLTVSAERKEEKKEEDKRHRTSEFSYGSYVRSFTFPTPVDAERSHATCELGILSLTIQKAASAKSRQITVK